VLVLEKAGTRLQDERGEVRSTGAGRLSFCSAMMPRQVRARARSYRRAPAFVCEKRILIHGVPDDFTCTGFAMLRTLVAYRR